MPSAAPTSTHSPDWQKLDFRQTSGSAPRAGRADAAAAAGAPCPAGSFSQRDIELFIAFLEWISRWSLRLSTALSDLDLPIRTPKASHFQVIRAA